IDNEDKSNPLSDEDLVLKLSEVGYPVARRTVTKYRKMLDIPSSRQRKDWTAVPTAGGNGTHRHHDHDGDHATHDHPVHDGLVPDRPGGEEHAPEETLVGEPAIGQ